MNRLTTFLAGLAIGAAAMFLAVKYHVVHAEDGVHLVPKLSSELALPYVDIREFDLQDWNENRELALAIMKADKGHLLQESAVGGFKQTMEGVLHNLQGG